METMNTIEETYEIDTSRLLTDGIFQVWNKASISDKERSERALEHAKSIVRFFRGKEKEINP